MGDAMNDLGRVMVTWGRWGMDIREGEERREAKDRQLPRCESFTGSCRLSFTHSNVEGKAPCAMTSLYLVAAYKLEADIPIGQLHP